MALSVCVRCDSRYLSLLFTHHTLGHF